MPVVVRFPEPHAVDIHPYQEAPLGPNQVRVKTLYSGISAGTELTAYRGSNPYLNKRWEEERRIFVRGEVGMEYPVEGWGYEEVGEISELGPGVTLVALGDVVFGTWGHRTSGVLSEEYVRGRRLPAGVDPVIGIFSHIGAIALNAILDADLHVGETAAVFGQGTPGLIVSQLARLNGARVFGVDAIPARLELATKLGVARTFNALESPSPAERIKTETGGRGADVCLEISGSYPALAEAVRTAAYNGRVVVSGFFQGGGTPLVLGEEFHHNRIELVCSQISGVAPRMMHRWDIHRLQRTVMDLAAAGAIDLTSLVSHVLPATDAATAFDLLDTRPQDAVQVVLDFREI